MSEFLVFIKQSAMFYCFFADILQYGAYEHCTIQQVNVTDAEELSESKMVKGSMLAYLFNNSGVNDLHAKGLNKKQHWSQDSVSMADVIYPDCIYTTHILYQRPSSRFCLCTRFWTHTRSTNACCLHSPDVTHIR